MTQLSILHTQGLYQQSAVQNFELGTEVKLANGKKYVYCKAGATALAAGKLTQSPAQDANVMDKTVAASVAIGATSVKIDAAGAIVANAYAGGHFQVNDATGEGTSIMIKSHGALSGAGELTLELYEALPVALTVDVSLATLVANPYKDTIICPTTLTGTIVGVPLIAVTATYYYWSQTGGVANVLINGTPGAGLLVGNGATTAGSVDIFIVTQATGVCPHTIVGRMMITGVSTDYKPVYLML